MAEAEWQSGGTRMLTYADVRMLTYADVC
jgi:hypothetical protein